MLLSPSSSCSAIYGHFPRCWGAPANISVLTTYIFNLTAVGPAAALQHRRPPSAIILMVVTGFLVLLQQRVLSGRNFTTVAGQGLPAPAP